MPPLAAVRPAILGCSYILAHVPDLVRYGSKPQRDAVADAGTLARLRRGRRDWAGAAAYLPHRVFVGAEDPGLLEDAARPWWRAAEAGRAPAARPRSGADDGGTAPAGTGASEAGAAGGTDTPAAARAAPPGSAAAAGSAPAGVASGDRVADGRGPAACNEPVAVCGPWGELLDQASFHRLLQAADTHGLVSFFGDGRARAGGRDGPGSAAEACRRAETGEVLVLHDAGEPVGFVRRDHAEDGSLQAGVLLENLAAKATGARALGDLLRRSGLDPAAVDYVLGCGEEAVGDRYQRGGGSLGKAMAEQAGCVRATGADVKAFCCSPLHALLLAGAAVAAGVFERVAVVGGASLAKLGMKYRSHSEAGMPVLEDVLAAFALLVGRDDGAHPVLDLAHAGRHPVGSGSAPLRIYEALIAAPLASAGLALGQVDRYATELHNPEITEPAGSGDVPRNNYRLLAALAVQAGEIAPEEMPGWMRRHGLVGWSPTQGHVASAVPYVGHALRRMACGRESNVLLVGKGSLFLGRMTQMSDGVSVLLRA